MVEDDDAAAADWLLSGAGELGEALGFVEKSVFRLDGVEDSVITRLDVVELETMPESVGRSDGLTVPVCWTL